MPTRNINLTEQNDRFIERALSSGRYKNVSEVVRAGLGLLESEARKEEILLAGLRKAAEKGFGDIDAGRFTELGADEIDDWIAGLANAGDVKGEHCG